MLVVLIQRGDGGLHWFIGRWFDSFAMPGEVAGTFNNLWNSFDYSGIHFIGFSTEHDFYPGSWQYRWIEMDLERAAKNRANVPVSAGVSMWCAIGTDSQSFVLSVDCHVRTPPRVLLYR